MLGVKLTGGCLLYLKETSQPASLELSIQKDPNEATNEESGNIEGVVLLEQQNTEVKAADDGPGDKEEVDYDWPRERVCHTHERAIPIQDTVEALDITEEGGGKWTPQTHTFMFMPSFKT